MLGKLQTVRANFGGFSLDFCRGVQSLPTQGLNAVSPTHRATKGQDGLDDDMSQS